MTMPCVAGFSKQVVLLWPQNSVCSPKSDLPDALHRSGTAAVSPCEMRQDNPGYQEPKYEGTKEQVHQGKDDPGGNPGVQGESG